jgi:ABC-type sugar transport system ATPase subunit
VVAGIPIAEGAGHGPVTLGVRPENVALQPGGLPATVELVEPLGAETLVHARMQDGTVLLVKLQGAVAVADRIEVSLDPAAVHLFDATTGSRIP